MKKTYALAKVGETFVLLWRGKDHSYWSQFGTLVFDKEADARRHAAICEIILD